MKVVIKRGTNQKQYYPKIDNNTSRFSNSVSEVLGHYGISYVNPLDIENLQDFDRYLKNIEKNRLYTGNNILYLFISWFGEYPFQGVIVERIGNAI